MNQATTLDDLYLYFLICWVFILLGTAIIYLTWKGVKFFVDPPTNSIFVPSHALIKNIFGTRGLVVFWYFLGACFLIVGSVSFFMGLVRLLKGLGHAN